MIYLARMKQEEYKDYRLRCINDLEKQSVEAGKWKKEEAKELAIKQQDNLLTEGVNTKNHYLFSIIDKNILQNIGFIWFAKIKRGSDKIAYLFDIDIKKNYRNKGYGKQAMLALEKEIKKYNLIDIELHVFRHNEIAINLYKKLGYDIIDTNDISLIMGKRI